MMENILAQIDAEIARLNSAKAILSSGRANSGPSASAAAAPRKRGRPAKSATLSTTPAAKRSGMSAEARERIRQAQVKRWAAKKGTKSNLNATVAAPSKAKKSEKSTA